MKLCLLKKRVDDLSEKLDAPSRAKIARFDFRCFTPQEQYLFEKICELKDVYGGNLPENVVDVNIELLLKAQEILFLYTFDTFKFFLLEALAGDDEVEKWYINYHFNNFMDNLIDCTNRVQKWPKKEREKFLALLKKERFENFSTFQKNDLRGIMNEK